MLVALASVTLAACAGSLFKNKAAPPTMYRLSAMPKSPAPDSRNSGAPAADLAVLKPRLRAGLDTDRIAALYLYRHMDYFAEVRWTGPLDQVLQDLAVQELH